MQRAILSLFLLLLVGIFSPATYACYSAYTCEAYEGYITLLEDDCDAYAAAHPGATVGASGVYYSCITTNSLYDGHPQTSVMFGVLNNPYNPGHPVWDTGDCVIDFSHQNCGESCPSGQSYSGNSSDGYFMFSTNTQNLSCDASCQYVCSGAIALGNGYSISNSCISNGQNASSCELGNILQPAESAVPNDCAPVYGYHLGTLATDENPNIQRCITGVMDALEKIYEECSLQVGLGIWEGMTGGKMLQGAWNVATGRLLQKATNPAWAFAGGMINGVNEALQCVGNPGYTPPAKCYDPTSANPSIHIGQAGCALPANPNPAGQTPTNNDLYTNGDGTETITCPPTTNVLTLESGKQFCVSKTPTLDDQKADPSGGKNEGATGITPDDCVKPYIYYDGFCFHEDTNQVQGTIQGNDGTTLPPEDIGNTDNSQYHVWVDNLPTVVSALAAAKTALQGELQTLILRGDTQITKLAEIYEKLNASLTRLGEIKASIDAKCRGVSITDECYVHDQSVLDAINYETGQISSMKTTLGNSCISSSQQSSTRGCKVFSDEINGRLDTANQGLTNVKTAIDSLNNDNNLGGRLHSIKTGLEDVQYYVQQGSGDIVNELLGLGGKLDGINTTMGTAANTLGGKIDGVSTTVGTAANTLGGKIDGVSTTVETAANTLGGKIDAVGQQFGAVNENLVNIKEAIDGLKEEGQGGENQDNSGILQEASNFENLVTSLTNSGMSVTGAIGSTAQTLIQVGEMTAGLWAISPTNIFPSMSGGCINPNYQISIPKMGIMPAANFKIGDNWCELISPYKPVLAWLLTLMTFMNIYVLVRNTFFMATLGMSPNGMQGENTTKAYESGYGNVATRGL